MELVIDIGNTRVKAAVFINNGIHTILYTENADDELYNKLTQYKIQKVIISSVRTDLERVVEFWKSKYSVLVLDHLTPLPIVNTYKTPKTLGKDRIAAVVGARFLHEKGPLLSIDIGTCITYDLLTDDNNYIGGSISPGIELRYKALHTFTSALPLGGQKDIDYLYGDDTETSLSTGVINGITHEIDGFISAYEEQYPTLKTLICGGDARYFVKHLKKKIFANQNLVLLGLHKILLFNEKNLN